MLSNAAVLAAPLGDPEVAVGQRVLSARCGRGNNVAKADGQVMLRVCYAFKQ